MNTNQIKKLSKYNAEIAFMSVNVADFPALSPGDRVTAALREIIGRIQSLAADQGSLMTRRSVGLKEEALDRLIKMIQKINRASVAMDEEVAGIRELFRMPRQRSERIWLATGMAFYNDSQPYETQFADYDLPADFRTILLSLIDDVQSAWVSADIAGGQKGGATGGLVAAFQDAGKLSRRLNAMVRNKYADDPEKLAAWNIASHLEATAKRKTPALVTA